jgi:PKD repeat protein
VGGTTANSASPKVMFNEAGIYSAKLKVIYEGGFDDTLRSDYINVSVLGTSIKNEVLIGNDFEVYPNPAMGSFEIKSYNNFNDVNVDLIDIMGKIMFSKKIELMTQNGIYFNVNELKSGIYFLNITTKSGVKFYKKMRIN